MGGEKKPLVMSDLGCADGCGRQMGAENCVDGLGATAAGDERPWLRGRRRQMGADPRVAGNGWGEEAAGDQRAWLCGGCGRQMGEENCADACGRRGCQGVAGNGWGEEAAGDQRAWLRGRLRTGNGCGELCGRLRAREWLEMCGEKKPLVMSELGCAAAADGKWVWRIARTAADGVGARVAGNGSGEEAAGDERAWLRGRLRTANGCGELRGWLRTAWVQGSGWKWVERRSRW